MLEKKISLFTNNKGNEFLTQLEATLELSDKLDSVVEAINNIPETVIPETVIPEPLEEVRITNLPEVQKVEITNLPQEKDDTEVKNLLKDLVAEVKKKEEYTYDIEIDPVLKEQLRGEKGDKGEPGLNGLDGKDGKDADTEEIKSFISKEVTNKLNKLPIVPIGGGRGGSSSSGAGGVQSVVAGSNITVDNTDPANPIVSATGGGGAVDSVNGSTGVVVLDTDDISEGVTNLYNKTHTGEVTGATALTLDKTAITNKTVVTAVGTDYVLISDTSDSGNLKKALVSDFGGGGGSLTKGIAEVDFGANTTESDIATVTVTDAAITSTSYPSVSLYALATTDHDSDDYMAEGLIPYVSSVTNGVGFNISVRAPNLTWGKYKITYQF